MLDQIPQRIGTRHRVIVDFSDAGLVDRGRRIEFARENLAAKTIGRLEDRDAAKLAQFSLQVPGAHQPARTTANDSKIKHLDSAISRAPHRNARSKSYQQKRFSA